MTGAQAVVTRPSTIAVRLHGRGGQGIVTAAELLAVAAFLEGQETQAFPSFGSERMGAPVTSYCRVSATPIRSREPVSEPDAVLIVDATLLHQVDVFAGLRDDGWVVINSVHAPDGLGIDDLAQRLKPDRLICIPATDIARTYLGRPLPNLCVPGRVRRVHRDGVAGIAGGGDPGTIPDRGGRREHPRRPCRRRAPRRGVPCVTCWKAHAPSPRRWRGAGQEWSPPIRSPRRPTSWKQSDRW